MSHKTLIAFLSFMTMQLHAQAASPGDQWFAPSRVSARASMLPQRDFSAVTMLVARNGDSRIETSGFSGGKSYAGTFLLVSGNYLVTRGVQFSPGREIDALDSPVLEVQTALKLLARAFPDGPSSVSGTRHVDIAEPKEAIEIATQSASGGFPAPWKLSGTVKRETPTKVSFTLSFAFAGSPQPLSVTGDWEKASSPPVFEDSFAVSGWRAFHLGPHQTSRGGTNVLDYGAQELPGGFATLGAIRAYAKRKAGGG